MTKNLMYKEFRLALHPTNLLFLALSAMLLIPNYPYYVTFFYTCLGIFFVCLTGRENHDIAYTAMLPVRKRDIVRARIAFAVALQIMQALSAIPFAILRGSFDMPGNAVGMDANAAFFGLAFIMLGLFNMAFFSRYYRNPDKIGSAFAMGSTACFGFMAIAEVCAHAVPFFRDKLDSAAGQYAAEKLAVLAVGLVLYALMTIAVCRRCEAKFENLDL